MFIAFTLSQAGMVVHWWRLRYEQRGWRWRAVLNGVGAVVTGAVAVMVGAAKFGLGAWVVLLLIPALVGLMAAIQALTDRWSGCSPSPDQRNPAPARAARRRPGQSDGPRRAGRFGVRPGHLTDVTAVHVATDGEAVTAMRERWEAWGGPVKLVILESPYRALLAPLLAYLDATETMDPTRPTTVILAEIVPRHLWEYPLHNQTALRLKLRLFWRPNTVVIDVPYHLTAPRPIS